MDSYKQRWDKFGDIAFEMLNEIVKLKPFGTNSLELKEAFLKVILQYKDRIDKEIADTDGLITPPSEIVNSHWILKNYDVNRTKLHYDRINGKLPMVRMNPFQYRIADIEKWANEGKIIRK